ncbi:glutathione peroxidase [Thalassotalea mangrovi]|uniref:Glutathione peroxidase n=1 Tax=Thalassotalea mangrovi TaxID=2572245 RepID=A0A4U1BAU5_9GAMM|nr:glutathione peroxidase [Thalassotalea mangrovi]TKB47535.1 glutathione peroxidase [Thalassotalea mangrovi]
MLKYGLFLALTSLAMTVPSVSARANDATTAAVADKDSVCPAILQHKVRKLHSSEEIDLCEAYQGKTLLIVNTASNCGFTPQFKALEALYQDYKDQGLVILGFPSDNFFQEEDDEKDTAKVCFVNYGVTFPMFATTEVRGDDAHPIFQELEQKTAAPYWNFYKYLVSSDGQSVQRFSSKVEPQSDELLTAIKKQL